MIFFAPKISSNRTTENNDKGININTDQKKRVKYDTESTVKVDNEINAKKRSMQISSRYWSSSLNEKNEKKDEVSLYERSEKLNLTINEMVIDDDNNLNLCPICGISLNDF